MSDREWVLAGKVLVLAMGAVLLVSMVWIAYDTHRIVKILHDGGMTIKLEMPKETVAQ